MMQHPRRSSQNWLALINSCRTSGMTITAWCQANTVPKGSYESAVKRLVTENRTICLLRGKIVSQ